LAARDRAPAEDLKEVGGQRAEDRGLGEKRENGPLAALRWLARRNQGGAAAPAPPEANDEGRWSGFTQVVDYQRKIF
jgi:hypothetical protein